MQCVSKPDPIVAERTYDADFIKSVVLSLWDTVTEDGQTDFSPEVISECWLNINNMAVFCLHAENSTTLRVHAHVLKEYRAYSADIGYAVWFWVLNNCPDKYQKFTCSIPVLYPNVKAYVESMGMVEEGVNRKSYCKNGEIVDQWLMGITRDELREFMQ